MATSAGAQQQAPDLDDIRQQARQLWSRAGTAEAACRAAGCSSYRSHYGSTASCRCTDVGGGGGGGGGGIGGRSSQQQKPASPHRRNKPHPSQLFLTCRLHSFPEYNCAECKDANEQAESVAAESSQDNSTRGANRKSSDSAKAHHLKSNRGRFSGSGTGQSHSHHRYHRCDPHPEGLVFQPTRVRGDFLIHPDWPPTLPHHQVP